eukprot:1142187-Prorocentrum_minimum.AAC.1
MIDLVTDAGYIDNNLGTSSTAAMDVARRLPTQDMHNSLHVHTHNIIEGAYNQFRALGADIDALGAPPSRHRSATFTNSGGVGRGGAGRGPGRGTRSGTPLCKAGAAAGG